MTEENKERWIKFLGLILATFIGAFLAFYFAVNVTINRLIDPSFHIKSMEKLMDDTSRDIAMFEHRFSENPFEPKMAPMLVNLVKEADEYKIIVDLKHIGGDEKNVDVKLNDNIVTVKGEMEKKDKNRENIVNFSQAFYLDETLNKEQMTKEKKGNKLIITIPFKD